MLTENALGMEQVVDIALSISRFEAARNLFVALHTISFNVDSFFSICTKRAQSSI